jgi:hypothetical protein
MNMCNDKTPKANLSKPVDHEVFDTIRNAEPIDFYGFTHAVMVTPEMAKIFLKHNTMNRSISDVVNTRYAQAMKAGHWKFNGETVVFSNTGILLDGQNRLKAIIKSGVTVPMMIIYGIEEDNFKTINQGSKRTTGQILKILNCENNVTLAATLRLAYIYLYLDNKMLRSGSDSVYHQVLLGLLERYPTIKESVKKAASAHQLCNRTIAAFCHFVFSLRDPRGADLFIRQVITGEDLHAGDPALSLRNVLIKNKGENIKLPSRTLIALFFKAWNYFRKGKTIKNLRWRDTETFPEVI